MKKQLPAWMVLLIITLVAGLALGGTDTLTRDPIAQQAVIAAENARKAALPAADSFAEMDLSQRIAAKQGFAGPVKVTLKLDENGVISALVIGDDQFAETAGFGAKALEEPFAAQFIGKTAPLTKADIDGIAGATVTTNAVLEAVNAAAAASAPQVDWCYEGLKDGQTVGYVAQVTVQGFGGPIEVIAGMDTEMVVTGISVGGSNFSETAGLGAKAKEVAFSSQFAGKPAPVKVIKAGGTPADNTVDAITAATITSNAVAGAVNKIADHVEGILFPEGRGDEIVLPEKPESGVFSAYQKGFKSEIYTEAAFDREGKITYISIGDDKFAETDGIGTQVLENAFMAQFIGKQMPLALTDIDAISGATVSSKAVVEALNKAYDQSKGVVVEEPAEPTLPEKPAEGVYGASAKGFAGPVWVDVAFDQDGKITYLSIGNDKFTETDGFGARAKEVSFMIQFIGKQMPLNKEDVDLLTGATVTSEAVVNALNKAYNKATGTAEEETAPSPAPTAAAPAAEGNVFSASSKGYNGPVWVEITLDGDKIAAIKIGDDRFAETTGLGSKALEESFAAQFVGKQLPIAKEDIDVIAGATVTTDAVISAINKAYQKSAPVAEEVAAPAAEEAAPAAEYIGVGKGFGGEIKVKVVMEGDKIVSIEILSHGETAGLADKSLKEIPAAIIANQSTDFTIDTATMGTTSLTNGGIIEAVNNALSQIAPAAEEAAPAAEYIGVGKGFGGEIKVKVTMEGDKLASIEILSHGETPGLSDKSLKEIPAAIIANQSTDFTIDTATMGTTSLTNGGIIEAVNNALSQIAPAAEYIGVGKGFGGEIKVKVTMEGDKIAAIEILSHGETPGLSDKSLKEIPAAIIANQSTDFTIDTATMGTTSLTNGGIIEAVNDAIKQAQQAASEQ